MQFGIAMATAADAWKLVERAEALGFSHAWFYDTQMLSADCFVAMGAAAVKTSRIRLGTGVLIPSNRIAPVTANALATLNRLAPGRIDFGVGTGFTGRRAMGFGAMKQQAMADYIDQVMALLDEETVTFAMEGKARRIRFLNPELGLINTRDPVALHLSAFGPKSRALTARLGAGWINFVGTVDQAVADLGRMREAWSDAGRDADELQAAGFTLGCVLKDGEAADSERAAAQAGPRAAVALHRAADKALFGLPVAGQPAGEGAAFERYIDWVRNSEPKDAPWIANHRGHLMFVKLEERPFITAELIRQTTFTAGEGELIRRIGALKDAGYTQFTIQIVPGQEDAIDDWARIKAAF